MTATQRESVIVLDECLSLGSITFLDVVIRQYGNVRNVVRIGRDFLCGRELTGGWQDTEVRRNLLKVARKNKIVVILVTRDKGFKKSSGYQDSDKQFLVVIILQERTEILKRHQVKDVAAVGLIVLEKIIIAVLRVSLE